MSKVAHSIQEKARTGDVQISESVEFGSLLLSDKVLHGLKNSGFVRPSPIQLKAIPLGRCGLDLIVQAKSGTGKTCVFSVIALESIVTDTVSTQVLVLAPTREIAVQIWEVINSIGSATRDLGCHTFIGGLPLHEDRIKLKKCHIAVGTPGRIKQLIEGGVLRTDSLRLFILDEADKLLEESFQEQINWIYSTLPENKQMLALSATYPEYLADHLVAYMRNPTFLRLNISDPALLGIRQYYKTVAYHPLSHVVFEEKCKVLSNILSSVSFQQCLVFSNLQTRAQTLADSLTGMGWPTACIAGCLDQKERNHAMAKLKTYKCRILISTDLTSRGIDADKVNMVINLDVPKDHETYLHRIGRAGRFGSFGIAVTLVSDGQEKLSLDLVEKQCNTQIYPLPDPLPSDLAKPGSPISLDDVVSSEVINTEKSFSNQGSPLKEKFSNIFKPALNSNSYKENKDENTDVCSTGDVSSSDGDKSKDSLGGKDKTLNGLKHENADNVCEQYRESDICQENVNSFEKNQITEARTAVNYEDVEYIEMTEKLQIDQATEIEFKNKNNIERVTGREIVTDRKIRKKDSETSIGNKFDESEDETKGKLLFVNNTRSNGDLNLSMESSCLNVKVDKKSDSSDSVSPPEMSLKTDTLTLDDETKATTKKRTMKSKGVVDLHSFSNNKLSASSFEKVNISNIFKNSTDFKTLTKPHSYGKARESLRMFRENHANGVETIETKENCSIPKLKNENSESDSLQCAINQVQDFLESRLYVQTCDTNTTKVEEESENTSEVNSISSEDEFEAKMDVLNEGNSVCAAFKVEVENNSQIYVDEQNIIEHKEKEKPKEYVKRSFQKPKKQRFGYQGNFAIGHLLQQERSQENCKTENAFNEGTGNEHVAVLKENDQLKIIADNVERMPDNFSHLPSCSRKTDDQNFQNQVQEGRTFSSLGNEEQHSYTFPIEEKDVGEAYKREKVFSINNEINLDNDSNSVSSTTDSESTDRVQSAITKMHKRNRKSPESRSRLFERVQRYRDHTRSDTKSEDSGVYSRSPYQEQWRRWYKQYEDWHQQTMNMWGHRGMVENPAHDLAGGMNLQDRGSISGWQYPSQSMYYPYHSYHHPSYLQNYYHPSYNQNYPYDYPMYHGHSNMHQNQNSSKFNEQMRDTFQFRDDYIKEMSKCGKK